MRDALSGIDRRILRGRKRLGRGSGARGREGVRGAFPPLAKNGGKQLIQSLFATAPLGFLLSHLFDASDWEPWAIITCALWWVLFTARLRDDTKER